MTISDIIKEIRTQKGLKQKDVYLYLGIGKSVYSKVESGGREITVQELIAIAKLFNMNIDDIINYKGNIPEEITLKEKDNHEQHQLFSELDDDDRETVLKIVDKMLTTKKFNQFIQENIKN